MSIDIDYENPWIFEGEFLSEDIDDLYGFVSLITNLTNGRKYIGRKNTSGLIENHQERNAE